MKAIIVYFSYMGNTKKIAEMIYDKIGGDIVRIETVVPYSEDYNQVVAQGEDEVNRGFMPEIKPLDIRLDDYDTVILGTPVWWYTFAPAIKTFIAGNDLSGKKIYPFATNGGWIGHTFKDIKNACADSVVEKGINIRFDEDNLRTPVSEIEKWIDGIK
mgnify:CR=1 FL=1